MVSTDRTVAASGGLQQADRWRWRGGGWVLAKSFFFFPPNGIKCAQRESDEKAGVSRGMQLEGLSIWNPQASGCWEVILSHVFFSLYFLLIRALLLVQLASPPSFCKAMIFHIVILSFFRLPRVGGWLLLCSDFAHRLPPQLLP